MINNPPQSKLISVMLACQMTIDLFDMSLGRFIDGVEYGAASFFDLTDNSDICLFV